MELLEKNIRLAEENMTAAVMERERVEASLAESALLFDQGDLTEPELEEALRLAEELEPLSASPRYRALLDYLDDPALLTRHAEAARARALAEFSLATMMARYRQVYRSL